MTDSAPSKGPSPTAAQRRAVLVGTIVLLTLGVALALATSPRDARPRSALASISSERALDTGPAPVVVSPQQPAAEKPPARPTKSSKGAPKPQPKASTSDSGERSEKESRTDASSTKKPPARVEGDDGEHETVKPPVRDDDEGEEDGYRSEEGTRGDGGFD